MSQSGKSTSLQDKIFQGFDRHSPAEEKKSASEIAQNWRKARNLVGSRRGIAGSVVNNPCHNNPEEEDYSGTPIGALGENTRERLHGELRYSK